MKNRIFVLPVLLLFLFSSLTLTACLAGEKKEGIVITSKQFTENILLAEMYAQLIESKTEIPVERRLNFGSTTVCYTAMENGEVDLYVEYTGTIYKEILKHDDNPDMTENELFDAVNKEMNEEKKITVFPDIGPNNTYALAMLRAKADALGVKKISDLKMESSKLIFAANDFFYTRANDGYDTMTEKYDLQFKSLVKMDISLLYDAAAEDNVDVIVVYATDSQLKKYDMVILEDDRGLFPDYCAVPIIRNEIISKYPELGDVLTLLTHSLDNERMQELNYLVDTENRTHEEVAETFLKELGLIE